MTTIKLADYAFTLEVSDEFVEAFKDEMFRKMLVDTYTDGTKRYWHFTPTGKLSIKSGFDLFVDMRHWVNKSTEINYKVDVFLDANPVIKQQENDLCTPACDNVKYIIIDIARDLSMQYAVETKDKLHEYITSNDNEFKLRKMHVIRKHRNKAQAIVDRCNKQISELGF